MLRVGCEGFHGNNALNGLHGLPQLPLTNWGLHGLHGNFTAINMIQVCSAGCWISSRMLPCLEVSLVVIFWAVVIYHTQ